MAILEINGAPAPTPTYTSEAISTDSDFVPPAQPKGAPWDRVLDWDKCSFALGAGDFAVIALQFRVGDGDTWCSYPQMMQVTCALSFALTLLQTSSKGDDKWRAAVSAELEGDPRSGEMLPALADWDFDYITKYFQPFYDGDAERWEAERYGERATMAKDLMNSLVPAQLELMMQTVAPDKKEELLSRFSAMGFDLESFLGQSQGRH
jgi:hypothetical protein